MTFSLLLSLELDLRLERLSIEVQPTHMHATFHQRQRRLHQKAERTSHQCMSCKYITSHINVIAQNASNDSWILHNFGRNTGSVEYQSSECLRGFFFVVRLA